ncbi:MAG: methyltransferase [Candidatus Acidiferrales bacterium]
MTSKAGSNATSKQLLSMADGLIIHQSLYAAAKLGVADLLASGSRTTAELAEQLKVKESPLYRTLRLLASQGVFEETAPRTFAQTGLSRFLCTGVPGSIRAILIFRGSEFFFAPYGEILHSIETGQPAREKMYGMNAFEHLREHPETARVFDDAMTNASMLTGPAVAAAYDFGAWASVMDVGGGNGILLAEILRAHPKLRGVLADLPHVLERARERGYLGGELEARSAVQPCDFFQEIPSGCRAYAMKSVIHDWDDERAHKILVNCRRAVPKDGVLLLVELGLAEDNLPSAGKLIDVAMMVLTGGKERTIPEYRDLLAGAGFRLNQVYPTSAEMNVIEAMPS